MGGVKRTELRRRMRPHGAGMPAEALQAAVAPPAWAQGCVQTQAQLVAPADFQVAEEETLETLR